MTIVIKTENLFAAHAEFNTIVGMLLMAIDKNDRTKHIPLTALFPEFTKAVDSINSEMQQFAIT